MNRRVSVLASAALALLFVAAACGIPADAQPHGVAPPYPYGSGTSSPPPPSPEPGELMEVLYLTKDSNLFRVTRPVAVLPNVQTLLADLAAVPTAAEQGKGLGNALAGTSMVEGVDVAGGLATVTLANTGTDGGPQVSQVLPIGQIVCTLTAREDVTAVVFVSGGVRASVPRGDGSQTDTPLRMKDYQTLIVTS
ncbi:MAG TPA: GerMN domain-containing protein [Micromonosporaceae bacterium]|jgi:hypothetical protein